MKKRRNVILSAIVAAGLALLLAYQAIKDIVDGNYVMGENYFGQPVGPGIQLLVLLVVLFVGIVSAWQYLHPRPESKRKKEKIKPYYGRWPYDHP